MEQGFLIDTNVLIDFTSYILPKNGEKYIDKIIDKNFTISFISYIEFLAFKNASVEMENFIALADVIEINKSIIDQTILLRKNSRIKLPDAIIAATAIVHDLILISRNIKDFKNIQNLNTLNPYTL